MTDNHNFIIQIARGPVSRVLSRASISLGLSLPTDSSALPAKNTDAARTAPTHRLLELASGWVYIASLVAKRAVGSYPAFSTLPI